MVPVTGHKARPIGIGGYWWVHISSSLFLVLAMFLSSFRAWDGSYFRL